MQEKQAILHWLPDAHHAWVALCGLCHRYAVLRGLNDLDGTVPWVGTTAIRGASPPGFRSYGQRAWAGGECWSAPRCCRALWSFAELCSSAKQRQQRGHNEYEQQHQCDPPPEIGGQGLLGALAAEFAGDEVVVVEFVIGQVEAVGVGVAVPAGFGAGSAVIAGGGSAWDPFAAGGALPGGLEAGAHGAGAADGGRLKGWALAVNWVGEVLKRRNAGVSAMSPLLRRGIQPAWRDGYSAGPRRSGESMMSTTARVTVAASTWLVVLARCRVMIYDDYLTYPK